MVSVSPAVGHPDSTEDARLVIGAAASGHGKTTVATGLMAALRRRSCRVAPFKVGPDYIDPGYHRVAAARLARNLDPVLVGQDQIGPLFQHGRRGAEVSIVEGVMGLFDGQIGTSGFGSTAHVAALLRAPVVLVVDARGQGQSLAALLHGFRSYQPEVRIGGVILNRVGSARHEEVLREATEAVGLPILGVLQRGQELNVPSRHLGLVPAAEQGDEAIRAVDSMADAIESGVDLDSVLRLAQSAPRHIGPAWNPNDEVSLSPSRPVVAIAGGPAFSFGYAEHNELLAAAGAEIAIVDPLRDRCLPPGAAGLVLPGGFPEQYAGALSANAELRAAIADFAAGGAPVHAECGGLLYLAEELDGYPLCGVINARAQMSPRSTLGYREAIASTSSVLFAEGERVTGHEFHRTVLTPAHSRLPAWRWRSRSTVAEGFVHSGVHASYLHTHPAGQPSMVERFVRRCVA